MLPSDEAILNKVGESGRLIISGPSVEDCTYYVSAALSDLHRLFSVVLSSKDATLDKKKNFPAKFAHGEVINGIDMSRKSLRLCVKKLEFYLSWMKSHTKVQSFHSERALE